MEGLIFEILWYFVLVYQGVFGHFTTLQDYFRRFPKATEDYKLWAKPLNNKPHSDPLKRERFIVK